VKREFRAAVELWTAQVADSNAPLANLHQSKEGIDEIFQRFSAKAEAL